MEKKELKLKFKKDVISNLQAKLILGGTDDERAATGGTCIDVAEGGTCNSDNGCTGGPNESMTCPAWGC